MPHPADKARELPRRPKELLGLPEWRDELPGEKWVRAMELERWYTDGGRAERGSVQVPQHPSEPDLAKVWLWCAGAADAKARLSTTHTACFPKALQMNNR